MALFVAGFTAHSIDLFLFGSHAKVVFLLFSHIIRYSYPDPYHNSAKVESDIAPHPRSLVLWYLV